MMSSALAWRLVDAVSRLLSSDEREAVCGDLIEAGASGVEALGATLGLVARRQAALWMHPAPWLASLGIAIPLGVMLGRLERGWGDGWAIDGFCYLHAWTWTLLAENSGFREALVAVAARDALHGAAVIGWSWSSGFALGRLSRETLWITGTLFLLLVAGATLSTSTGARANPFNAEVFAMPLYNVVLPRLAFWFLILMPALIGMDRSLRRSPFSRRTAILVALVIGVLTVSNGRSVRAAMRFTFQQPAPPVGTPRVQAPDFTLRDAKGKQIRLSDYKGRVLLLDFWATWCGGCKQEIPWYLEFDAKYRKRGLASLGVAMDDDGWKTVTPYLAEHPISYPIVIADKAIVKSYALTSLPLTLLIDRQGRIADTHLGVVDKHAWEQEIVALLAERR